jgi:hypothetical protein
MESEVKCNVKNDIENTLKKENKDAPAIEQGNAPKKDDVKDEHYFVKYYDTSFSKMFYESNIEFQNLDAVTQHVCIYENLHGTNIKVKNQKYRNYIVSTSVI